MSLGLNAGQLVCCGYSYVNSSFNGISWNWLVTPSLSLEHFFYMSPYSVSLISFPTQESLVFLLTPNSIFCWSAESVFFICFFLSPSLLLRVCLDLINTVPQPSTCRAHGLDYSIYTRCAIRYFCHFYNEDVVDICPPRIYRNESILYIEEHGKTWICCHLELIQKNETLFLLFLYSMGREIMYAYVCVHCLIHL